MGAVFAPIFLYGGRSMNQKIRNLTQSALIATIYVVLTYLQDILLHNTTSLAIQFRASEALCVLAFFSPNAIWGLTVGCLLYNITVAGMLPLDIVIGSFATFLATGGMYLTRNVKIFGYPFLGMLLPAIANGLLIGWELTFFYLDNTLPFWLNATYVAIGEAAVLLTLGTVLYYVFLRRNLHMRIF